MRIEFFIFSLFLGFRVGIRVRVRVNEKDERRGLNWAARGKVGRGERAEKEFFLSRFVPACSRPRGRPGTQGDDTLRGVLTVGVGVGVWEGGKRCASERGGACAKKNWGERE